MGDPLIKLCLTILSIACFLHSCSDPSQRDSNAATIFAKDNRQVLPANKMPYRSVGLVSIRGNKICSGTLVGKDLVLTSAHCLVANKTASPSEISFHLGVHSGKQITATYVSEVFLGTKFPKKDRANDWAILRLKKPLGAQFGYLLVEAVFQHNSKPFPVSLAGYSVDFFKKYKRPSLHMNCYVRYSYNNLLRHDCDSDSGASGGPLLIFFKNQQVRVIGIHVTSALCWNSKIGKSERCMPGSTYSHDIANYGVSAQSFYEILNKLRLGHQLQSYRWNP